MDDWGIFERLIMGIVEKDVDVCLDDSEVTEVLQSAVCLPLLLGGAGE